MDPVCRLLIVDDDVEFADILNRRFVRRGFSVAVCDNCRDALETARQQKFDVAIVDWTFTEGSGAELVRQLKAADPMLPIIVLSGHAGAHFATEATRAGATTNLSKPCSLGDLEAAVAQVCQCSQHGLPVAQPGLVS